MALDDNLTSLATAIGTAVKGVKNSKQDTLVSGNNIKTVNGNSLLGSGNISISGGAGGTQNVFIQTTAPTLNTGDKALWIDTTGENLNFWIVTGD